MKLDEMNPAPPVTRIRFIVPFRSCTADALQRHDPVLDDHLTAGLLGDQVNRDDVQVGLLGVELDAVHKFLPGTGHACCIEDPAGFDALVLEFLSARGLLPAL